MTWIDWIIVVIPVSFVIFMAFRAKRYARSAVDFLAAGRVAGRYVISVGDLATGLSVITLISSAEAYFQQGLAVAFWNLLLVPVGLAMSLTGFCTYRWRQIRCLSKGEFLEIRYGSKVFRIVTATISTLAEAITNAIGPAIAANFFIYYLGLPHRIMICGIGMPCYVIIVIMCLALATIIIMPAGRISLMITDSIQGLLTYPIFIMVVGFLLLKFSWGHDIMPVLMDRVPRQSFLNPYDISAFRDFNFFALVYNLTVSIMNRCAWFGNDSTNSGRNPHEQKMASIMGAWRNGFSLVAVISLSLITIAYMNSGKFAKPNKFGVTNNEVRHELSNRILESVLAKQPEKLAQVKAAAAAVPDVTHEIGIDPPLSQKYNLNTPYLEAVSVAFGNTAKDRSQYQEYKTLFHQQMMPYVIHKIFPMGLFGAFCLLMVMLLISTDDSRLFNAVGCVIQDIALPCIKHKITPSKHISLLRWGTIAMAVFFFIVAIFFRSIDYINMFTTIMCAFWTSAAGPIMTLGLYTSFGNINGAWCALIFGSGSSLIGLIAQRNWADLIFPFIDKNGWVPTMDKLLRTLSHPFEPWIHWEMSSDKFPINSMELSMLSLIIATLAYIVASYLTYKPFNMDKMLHRGKYNDTGKPDVRFHLTLRGFFSQIIGITSEYTKGDKVIAYSVFAYSFIYNFCISFVLVNIWNLFSPWSIKAWSIFALVHYLVIPCIIGFISTVWFGIGGVVDTIRLFKDLENRNTDNDDNGQICSSNTK